MLLNKSKDLLFFVLLLTFLNLMGPGAFLLSVPIFLFDKKLNNKALISGIFVSGFLSFIFSYYLIKNPAALTFNSLHFFVLTLPFLYFMKKGIDKLFIVLVLVVFSTFSVLIIFELINNTTIMEYTLNMLLSNNGGDFPKELIDSVKTISKYGSGIISVSEGFLFLLNIFVYSWIKKVKIKFDSFKIPEFLLPVFIFVAIIFIALTLSNFNDSYFQSLSFNLLITILFFYFTSGLAIVMFWLNIAKTPSILKVFIYITCFMQPGLIMLLAIGFADFWLNIRKRLIKKYLN